MEHARRNDHPPASAKVIDFDEHLFEACPAEVRADLMQEAELLAGAFAPEGDVPALLDMAAQLSAGARDAEMGRARARKLAAALKRLAACR